MTIPSKVNLTGANTLAQLNPLPKAAAPTGMERQVIADSGKAIPAAALSYEQLVENRKRELGNAVKTVSGYVQNIARELNFSVDETLGKTVVTVVDQSTGELIRQIPTEDMLELSRNLAEIRERSAKGLLFRGDA
jgi:flagellar protein FlaG